MKQHNTQKTNTSAKMSRQAAVTKHMNKSSPEANPEIQNAKNPKLTPMSKSRTAEIAKKPLNKDSAN